MIQTGKYFEGIVEMLNTFRTEVSTFSSLGLLNINKHSENFMKKVLNLTYGYELENLNKEKLNFPGIDLGDTGEGVAYQITSTKKSEKIDNTLSTCLKYKHYETFKTIKVFVLTSKQTSYTLKVDTEPYFTFDANKNIVDFTDLLKDIENLDLVRIKALHDFIKSELQPTIDAIRNDKSDDKKTLLTTQEALKKTGMTTFYHWRSKVSVQPPTLTVPDIHSKLNAFFKTPIIKNQLLPILNPAYNRNNSTKEILYLNDIQRTGVSNIFFGQAMLIEKSSITIERASYGDADILTNLYQEMLMLLSQILFFSKHSQSEITVSISFESNANTHFYPGNSLVMDRVFNSYILESPFELEEILPDVSTETLAQLLQAIIHGFTLSKSNSLGTEPFLTIRKDLTESAIKDIKENLGVQENMN